MSFPLMPAILNAVSVPRVVSVLSGGLTGFGTTGVGPWSVADLVRPASSNRVIIIHAIASGVTSTGVSGITVVPNTGPSVILTALHYITSGSQHNSIWGGFIPNGVSCSVVPTWLPLNGRNGLKGWCVSGLSKLAPDLAAGVPHNSAGSLGTIPRGGLALGASAMWNGGGAYLTGMPRDYSLSIPSTVSTMDGWSLNNPASDVSVYINAPEWLSGPASMIVWN